jgi:FMN phosphatase YigB (HAD superfamily)/DNA-binding XRE family transcriptional regulator
MLIKQYYMAMDEVGLGKLLQNARKKAGMTQQELCQKAGLSYSTLAKIERGAIKAPSIFTIQSIASALNTSLNELVGESTARVETQKKRSKSGVRFVYFDINGCLVRFFHPAFTRLAEDTGQSADVIETAFWHFNDAVCRGDMTMSDFNREFAERLGIDSLDWQSYYFEAIDTVTEMQELLRWASEHYHVGLLSNIMPGFIPRMIREGVLPNVPYSQIIDSSVERTIKPEQQIFEIAAERAGVEPNEILLIDDSRANLITAEKQGWKVIWFDDYRPDVSVKRIQAALEPEQ